MILVLFLLGAVVLILTVIVLILSSTLRIEIKNLYLSNMEESSNKNYAIVFSLYFANKVKWLWFNLNNKRIRNYYSKMHLEKYDFKMLKDKFELKDLKIFKKLNPKISYFNLQFDIGTYSPITTSFLTFGIASIVSTILLKFAKSFKSENYKYQIVPMYKNKNLYKINFNCIIEAKMVHIINIIKFLIKKGKSDKNERTTSNRKSYGYSYE